jgi:glutathione S-transferase
MMLHYSPRSPFVRKVMIFLHETGLMDQVQRHRAVTSMLRPNPELMQFNPWSKIPTLVLDDGLPLFDSDVIMEYLDTRHDGPKLHPQSPEWRWKALRWRAFGSEMLAALILWRNERERQPGRQLPQLIDAFALKMQTGMEMLEREAAELARAPLNVGHIAIGCALGYQGQRFAAHNWLPAYPQLKAWFDAFSQRPSYIATAPFDDLPRYNAAGERI